MNAIYYCAEQVGTRWRVAGPDTSPMALYYTREEAERAAAVFNRAARGRQKLGIPPVAIHLAPVVPDNPPTISRWRIAGN